MVTLTVLFSINVVLFGLFYANTAMLFGAPLWVGLCAVIPLGVARWLFPKREFGFLSAYAQGSMLVGVAVVVWVVMQRLLNGEPVAERLLLPLLVAVVMLYVLGLYLRWQRLRAPTHDAAADLDDSGEWRRLTFWVVGPSLFMSFAVAVVFAAYTLLALSLLAESFPAFGTIAVKFTGRGVIPPVTLIFFYWAMLILVSKWLLLSTGRRLLLHDQALADRFDSPQAQDNGHADEFMHQLWLRSSESYLIPKYLNWSIPILGFIGTVLGISLAADGIQRIISSQEGLSQLSSDLGDAIAPLGIAFDTTLIALSLSILLTLVQTLQQRAEDRVLNTVARTLNVS